MSILSLKAELRQQLHLSPQLFQSMEILQMNSQELLEYLNRISEENPLLEREEDPALRRAYEALRQRAVWLDGGVCGPAFSHAGIAFPERAAMDQELESLGAFLRDQLDRLRLPKPLLALSRYMTELLDADGYLEPEELEALRHLEIPSALITEARETLQSLEPAGVGAGSLSECLLLQLRRRENVPPAALDVAEHFLPELSQKRYGAIARESGLEIAEIQAAERIIASLEPYPGRAFQQTEITEYVRPDVFIVELDRGLEVVLNEYYLPRITINSYYTQLLRETDERETRDYLRQKLHQAQGLLYGLERRGGTLRRCADAVLEAQYPFFAGETAELVPMRLLSLAESLGLHPSTVSRALQDKYLQCRQGTYPLRYFFSRSIGGLSQQAVKRRIVELVRQEDPRHPLSDQRLCILLAEDGVEIARRTAAKYRMELGIASSAVRKQRNSQN